MNIQVLSNVIFSTPWWLWVMYIALIGISRRTMGRHIVTFPRLIVAALSALGWVMLMALPPKDVRFMMLYGGGLLVGGIMGFVIFAQKPIKIDRASKILTCAGDYFVTGTFLLFLLVHYFFRYFRSIDSVYALNYVHVETALYFLIAGMIVGRITKALRTLV